MPLLLSVPEQYRNLVSYELTGTVERPFSFIDLPPTLLRIPGQHFFLLYTLRIVAYLKIGPRVPCRVFGIAALAVCIVFAGVFGWGLLYAAALFALPYLRRGFDFRRARPPPGAAQPALGD